MPQRLLHAAEVAAILDVKESRVYELNRLGLLPSIRLGRQLRFDPDQLNTWIAGGGKPLEGGWKREPVAASIR